MYSPNSQSVTVRCARASSAPLISQNARTSSSPIASVSTRSASSASSAASNLRGSGVALLGVGVLVDQARRWRAGGSSSRSIPSSPAKSAAAAARYTLAAPSPSRSSTRVARAALARDAHDRQPVVVAPADERRHERLLVDAAVGVRGGVEERPSAPARARGGRRRSGGRARERPSSRSRRSGGSPPPSSQSEMCRWKPEPSSSFQGLPMNVASSPCARGHLLHRRLEAERPVGGVERGGVARG